MSLARGQILHREHQLQVWQLSDCSSSRPWCCRAQEEKKKTPASEQILFICLLRQLKIPHTCQICKRCLTPRMIPFDVSGISCHREGFGTGLCSFSTLSIWICCCSCVSIHPSMQDPARAETSTGAEGLEGEAGL